MILVLFNKILKIFSGNTISSPAIASLLTWNLKYSWLLYFDIILKKCELFLKNIRLINLKCNLSYFNENGNMIFQLLLHNVWWVFNYTWLDVYKSGTRFSTKLFKIKWLDIRNGKVFRRNLDILYECKEKDLPLPFYPPPLLRLPRLTFPIFVFPSCFLAVLYNGVSKSRSFQGGAVAHITYFKSY